MTRVDEKLPVGVHVFDADQWETTYDWGDRDMPTSDLTLGDVMELGLLVRAPYSIWAACVSGADDHVEIQYFTTPEEAESAAVSGQGD